MATRKPTPELKAFGAELTRLREEAGITRTELARQVNVTRSYVGQVEAGTTRCRLDFAERVDQALKTGSTLADAWDDLLRSKGYPRWFGDFPRAELSAALLRAYENTLVYGLFQTEAYARELLISDSAVTGRMKRQAILIRDKPPTVCVVMDESVLYRQVGDRAVMCDQLEHLITVSGGENVSLQVALTGYYRGVQGSFTIASQPDGGQLVYLANVTRGETSNDPDDILYATKSFAKLQARALSEDGSRDMIRRVLEERWT